MRPKFVRYGVYSDIPVPFTRYIICLDLGYHKNPGEPLQPIWALGYRYRR